MEHLFEIAPSGIIIHIRESCGFPCFRITLDDEGAGILIEFIGMSSKNSGAVFAEDKRQTMKQMPRTELDVFVASRGKIGLELILELGTNSAHYAIGANDKIVSTAAHKGFYIGDRPAKMKIYVEVMASILKHFQHFNARDARKFITTDGDLFIPMDNIDVLPFFEPVDNGLPRWDVLRFEIVERFIRKNDTPAEGIGWRVALEEVDVDVGTPLFYKERKIQTRRSAADYRDLHLMILKDDRDTKIALLVV